MSTTHHRKHILEKCVLSLPKGLMSLVITAIIVYLSLDSNPLSLNRVHLFRGFDKIAHFIMYFACAMAYILDFVKFRLPHKTCSNHELAVMCLAIILGGIMEVLQLVMDNGRSYDPLDWLADALGAIAAFLFLHLWYLHFFRRYYYGYYGYHKHKASRKK